MGDDVRRRGIKRTASPAASTRTGSDPRPNVLSDGTTPNRLSSEAFPSSGDLGGTRQATTQVAQGGSGVRPRRSLSIPSLSTLVFLGFVVITVLRIAGQVLEGSDDAPAATPVASAPAGQPSGASTVAGPILFGTGADAECGVTGAAISFDAGAGVWWSAELATPQALDSPAIVLVHRDGETIDRVRVADDPASGTWNRLCSSEPVISSEAGTYRVEVWAGTPSTLQAAGGYTIAVGPP